MSYILEALKKSQAERQLGELPSIHAPQVQLHDGAASGAARRTPVWLALGGVAVAVAVASALLLWQSWQAAATAPAVAPAVLAQAVPAPMPAVVPPAVPVPAPVAVAVPPAAIAAPVHHARPVPEPKQESPVPAPAPAVPVPAPAAAAEETVPGMRDLPEPIQRQIPPVAIGGYIYSKNPADRLLLIDKVLRHEGEELAPGLVLEKLQPKAAIFSFKGYRYRVPY
ncbi:general secretion pathway protein GspB [Janthinobacterium sp. Ant5-2-1]|uniref:general secretion pathway protein GspB n=1 Tax=Janthinobacterium sp. Ant5-2-1 TaxID=1755239 RepID=UPI000717F4B6|nr:general secretion pathway protein GspB [Janthinobacterium sp. Ant5-2-1]